MQWWMEPVVQVLSTVIVTVPLLRAAWRRRYGDFSYWTMTWKLVLYAIVVWIMTLGISIVVRHATSAGHSFFGVEQDNVMHHKRRECPYPLREGGHGVE